MGMALPVGVTVFELRFGKSVDFEGDSLQTDLTIVPSHEVVWASTGDPLVPAVISAVAVAGEYGSISLPQTGQAGLVDRKGNTITNWWYTVTGSDSKSGRSVGAVKSWKLQPEMDQLTVDLDLLPTDGTVGPVGSVASPAVTSVNGASGAVTVPVATDASVAAFVTAGGPTEAALSATITTSTAADMANPESGLNSATVDLIGDTVGSISSIPGFNDARGVPSKARIGSGPQLWIINPGESTPMLAVAGDVVWQATVTELPWTPNLLANKLAWLDAQSLGLANAAAVASWTDLSGNGNHFVQATSGARPVMNTTKINGHPAVVADGTDDILGVTLASALASQAFTIYLVGGTDLADNTSGSDFLFSGKDGSGVATKLELYRTTTEQYAISRGTALTSSASAWTTGHKLMKIVFNGGSSSLTVGGVSQTTGTTALAGTSVAALSVFGRADNLNFFPGYLGEVIIVLGTVSGGDDTSITNYLTTRWGL